MKTNKILITCLTAYFTIIAFASQNDYQNEKHKLNYKADVLKEYFLKSFNNKDSLKYRFLFFNEFPSNYNDFKVIYGYSETDTTLGLLYSEAEGHIIFFFKLGNIIEKDKFILKTINIAINGKWQADGGNYFLVRLKKQISNNLESYCRLLSRFSDNGIKNFWVFVFDGPLPNGIPQDWGRIKEISPRIYDLMRKGNKEVLEFRKPE
jgi:hypothetical protein